MMNLTKTRRPSLALLALAVAAAPTTAMANDDDGRWVISADAVYTAAGDVLEGGTVVVADGKIVAVGPGGSGNVLEVAAVTPGFVDLAVRIDTDAYSVEQSTEASFTSSIDDSLDLFSYRWKRALASGVTTALATPSDMNVIGGLCTVLKTGGAPTLEARTLVSGAALRACLGPQPSAGNQAPRLGPAATFYYRRPTTRMGVEWVFRKSFYDAINAKRFGLDVASEDAAQNAVALRVIDGELPIIVKTQATQDVRTAIYLKEEFGIPRMILDDAVEAWKEPELLRRSGVAVVLPPAPKDGRVRDDYANDNYFLALESAATLKELGVLVALSGHGSSDPESRIANQAGFAMRGGMSFEDALAAVTINPAKMMGVDDRVGSIEVGKDADLVLWNGTPFEPTSAIIGVLLNGELVVDPRPAE